MDDSITNKKSMEATASIETISSSGSRETEGRLAQKIEKTPDNSEALLGQELAKGKEDINTLKNLVSKLDEDPENERSALLIYKRLKGRFEELYESSIVAINLSEKNPSLLGKILDGHDALEKEYAAFAESSQLPQNSLLKNNPGSTGTFEQGVLGESNETTDQAIIDRLVQKLEAVKNGNEVPKMSQEELKMLAGIMNSPEAQAKMKELEARGVTIIMMEAEKKKTGFDWQRALLVVGAGVALGVGITIASPAIGALLNAIFGAGTWNSVVSFLGSATQTIGSFFSGLFSSGQTAAATSASGIQAGAGTAEALSGAAATAAGSTGMTAATGTGVGSAGSAAAEALAGALLAP